MERSRIDAVVYASLGRQLGLEPAAVAAAAQRPLEDLGLDSHGLMRVLLAIEEGLGLEQELDLPDAALATPASLAAGVATAVA